MQHQAPVVYGKYQLLELLARGGMAEVFKAKSHGVEGFEKVLVIKRILPELSSNPDFVEMFINEAKIAVTLSHANVVQVFDLGRADETYFIAMEYVAGSDLATVLRRARKYDKPLPIELAVYVIAEVAKGLDYAHRRRDADLQPLHIVHRDVSPQNVLLSYEGEVKLTDFGIAKARGSVEDGTAAGVLKGKYAYMAPEQARGREVDARTDLFSLGTVLYEALAGRSPFLAASTYDTLQRVRSGEAKPLAEVSGEIPEELSAIVARAMSPHPADRHEDAGRFYEDLVQFLYSTGRRVGGHDLSNYLDNLRALSEGRKKRKAGPTSTDTGLRRAFDMETSAARVPEAHELTPAEVPSARSTGAGVITTGSGKRSAPRAERRDVTVMALGAGPGAPKVLARLIERAGGQVVEETGDLRYVLFGLKQSDGRDTETVARLALHLPESFPDAEVRMGVHAGRVVLEADRSIRKDEAYRKLLARVTDLAARAKAGRALVSTVAAKNARRFFELLQVDENSHELVAERDLAEAFGRFVGRRTELRRIGEALATGSKGKQTLVSVIGEAGSGKTRLLLETMRRVRAGKNDVGMIITRVPQSPDVPLSACQALLREVLGIGDLESPDETAEKVNRLRELGLSKTEMDAVAKAVGLEVEGEGDTAQRPLRAAIARIATKLAQDRLTVFAFDDLEGIDPESLQLLQRLARTPTGGRILIVVAHRDDAPFEWEGFPNHIEVRLGPLGDDDIARLVAARLGVDEVPAELLREIVLKSSGNPLYVEEYLLALQEAGAVAVDGGKALYRPGQGVEVPRSLRGIISGRLERLGEDERAILRLAAVVGGRFHVAMLAHVTQLPRERVGEVLEGLVGREILVQTGAEEMGFAHGLVPEIVRSQLPLDARRQLHAAVAESFEAVYPDHLDELAERLAHHYREAGKRSRAIDYLVRAADRLEGEFALGGAVGMLARAIEMIGQAPSPDRERELELHRRVANLCLRGREVQTGLDKIEIALELAENLGRDEHVARFSLAKGLLLTAANRFGGAEPWFERARQVAKNAGLVELLGEIARGDAEARARNGDNARAAVLLEEALELAQANGDVTAQRRALLPLALAYGGKGDAAAARSALSRVEATLEQHPERIVECELWKTDGLVSFLTGNLERTLDSSYRALHLAKEYGFAYEAAVNAHNIGETLMRMGDFKRAFAMLRYSYDLTREHGFLKLQYNNLRVLGYIDAVKLQSPQGRARVEEALAYAEEHDFVWDTIQSAYMLALVDCSLGDVERARAGFQRVLRLANDHGHAHYAAAAETALEAMDAGRPVPLAN
ncbi:MAG: hypothetical protein CMN30_00525 [Sandaracinus sp.]|nr:hypothetical protein [Sandaracinus sp.]